MMALEAVASITSDSVIPPTALCITLTLTSSLESLRREALTASAEPATSALTMILRVFVPSDIWLKMSSRLTLAFALSIS